MDADDGEAAADVRGAQRLRRLQSESAVRVLRVLRHRPR